MIFAVLFSIGILIACLLPLWHVLMASISDPTAVSTHTGFVLWPLKNIDLTAYEIILNYEKLWRGYRNTILYIFLSCGITTVLSVIAGYVFSRKSFYYRNKFMMFITFTMMFNGGTIPSYLVIRKLGMLDTIWALIIPGCLSVFNIILMRTAIEGVPNELVESARIDGASEMSIIFRIIIPMIVPTIAVVVLFTAVGVWNNWYNALLYLPTRQDLYPLQMALRDILVNTNTANDSITASNMTRYFFSVQYASIVVSTVPILCVYPFVQKYFVKGLTIGAVKN